MLLYSHVIEPDDLDSLHSLCQESGSSGVTGHNDLCYSSKESDRDVTPEHIELVNIVCDIDVNYA